MKITKQKIWMIIQVMIAAYLIISSCMEPGKPYVNKEKQLTQNERLVFKQAIKSAKIFPLNNH